VGLKGAIRAARDPESMAIRSTRAARGTLLARGASLAIGRELRDARIGAGLSQATVASTAGIAASQVGRIERGEQRHPPVEEQWGFCVSHAARQRLVEGQYRVVVDSELTEGSLTYGELIIPGMTTREVLLSTYVCHPSMANNETSGPAVTTFLAKWIASAPRRHTYRIVFVPETIGSLAYLSRNLAEMKRNIVAGFNVTCVGDDRAFSFLPSRKGSTLADRAALCILRDAHPDYVHYSFLDRGSDERQYCSPGVELPVVSIMRSKYGEYPEYHTSLDNLDFITPKGLQGGFSVLRDCLELLEANLVYQATCLGEPQLSRRGLYPKDGGPGQRPEVRDLLNVLAYADGTNDLIDISTAAKVPAKRLYPVIETLLTNRLLVRVGGE